MAWIGNHFPVTSEAVIISMIASPAGDGVSDWRWFNLADGTLIFGRLPEGATFEKLEPIVGLDWERSLDTLNLETGEPQ